MRRYRYLGTASVGIRKEVFDERPETTKKKAAQALHLVVRYCLGEDFKAVRTLLLVHHIADEGDSRLSCVIAVLTEHHHIVLYACRVSIVA
ncbi:unnamed protein product [Rangifer tarandus platyrhynchus]|uniref:ENTH domain-containing protein n=1 Tax=Rangifer tarandus platyrhynchus TaxID=3082113 RepID=A0ABN8XMG0_RANTA|nr:unnamed protein product [Rangifer tarandus platyrhynchus]